MSIFWNKSDIVEKFKEFKAFVTNECGHGIVKLRTDNRVCQQAFKSTSSIKEYSMNWQLPTLPSKMAQLNTWTALYWNQHELCCHKHTCQITQYWAEAVAPAAYLKNQVTPAFKKDQTPFERWYGKKPDISHLRVFRSSIYLCTRLWEKKIRQNSFVSLATPRILRDTDWSTK